jgi:hypothetical protein
VKPGCRLHNLHALLAYQLLPPRVEALAGRLRTQPVLISHSTYTPLNRATELEPHFKSLLKLATTIPTAVEAVLRHCMVPLSCAGVDASSYSQAMLLFYETLDMEPPARNLCVGLRTILSALSTYLKTSVRMDGLLCPQEEEATLTGY